MARRGISSFRLLADEHGNVEILGRTRVQHSAPASETARRIASPALSDEVRERVSAKLQEAIRAIGYSNAGTVEFLMDEKGDLYFIEVNARIQVEHPVTEAVTGVDLVKAQIRIAAGETLEDILGGPVAPRPCHRCRINAENPETFVPSPGRITGLNLPGGIGIRVDTHGYQDGVIPPYYDSLVAKLIAHGKDREEAIQRMKRALDLFVVEGIHTSIPLHKRILNEPDFVAGSFDTNFIKRWM